jgi:hypothetical protein
MSRTLLVQRLRELDGAIVSADLATLTRVWMGDTPRASAIRAGRRDSRGRA